MAFTNEQILEYWQALLDQGMSQDDAIQQMISAAEQYGVSYDQIDEAFGFDPGSTASYIQNMNAPQEPAPAPTPEPAPAPTPAPVESAPPAAQTGTTSGTNDASYQPSSIAQRMQNAYGFSNEDLSGAYQQMLQKYTSEDGTIDNQGLFSEVYDLATAYGIPTGQLAAATGWSEDNINAWLDQNNLGTPTAYAPNVTGSNSDFDIQDLITSNLQLSNDMLQNFANWQPPEINIPSISAPQVTPETYEAQRVTDADIQQYMNPYTDEVVNRTLGDIERSRVMGMNNLGFSADQAKAFGGSRHGVAEAETNRAFADRSANAAANLRQTAYNQALNTATQNVGMENQGGQFNAQQMNTVGLQNVANNIAAQSANAANQLSAQTSMAGNQLNAMNMGLNASSQAANLANLGFGMQNTVNGNMWNQGTATQNMNQNLMNQGMQQWGAYQNQGSANLGLVPNATGAFGNMGTTTSTQNPGFFDYAALASSTLPYII